ncbi:MAG: preprotein translocase subunit YajC [Elusimicrobia bacterium]|nr:preprotein translocase subunit YajC [Elusimicrobiota bacterium]
MSKISLKSSLFLVFSLASNLHAADPQQANAISSFMPLVVIFVIFYFFLIRPQQKKAKDHQKMINELQKDDKVITAGGMFGVVSSVKGEIVEVKIAENVKVQISKGSISVVLPPEGQNQVVTPEIVK